jgi:hypothetical protein
LRVTGIILICSAALFSACIRASLAQQTALKAGRGSNCEVSDNGGLIASVDSNRVDFTISIDPKDDGEQRKRTFIYIRILTTIISNRLNELTSGRCAILPQTEPAFRWHLSTIPNSDIAIDEFRKSIEFIKHQFNIFENADLRYPTVGANRAAGEAYRHIYAEGSNEWIYTSISADDYRMADLESFIAWFKAKREDFLNSKSVETIPPRPTSPEKTSRKVGECVVVADVKPRQLYIGRRAWGHHAIVMVRNGYDLRGQVDMRNSVLGQLCGITGSDQGAEDWRAKRDVIGCFNQSLGSDRWLILYSKREPARTSMEMTELSKAIGESMIRDKCADNKVEIIVAKFANER